MELVNDPVGGSFVTDGRNSGQFNLGQRDSRGSTTAAHEFGHMLGYNVPKNGGDPGVYGSEHHAWRKILGESFFIMGDGGSDEKYSQRRVNPAEYTRINGGLERREKDGVGGLYMPTKTRQIYVANPQKPMNNIQKK